MWQGRFNYSRKLLGMALIVTVLALYFLKGGKGIFIIIGGFLIVEHYFIWDRWDAYDYLLGHEWWGLYMICWSFTYYGLWWSSLLCLLGFILGATYDKRDTFGDFRKTIKELWGSR